MTSPRTAMPPPDQPRVVVVGAGLTGLATAWHLRDDAEVTVLDAAAHAGGQIRTVELAGAAIDVGAEAYLARHPHAVDLVRAVGVGDEEVVAPALSRVALWTRGRLRPLPERTVMGVPTDPIALARSGVLPPSAVVRAALEPLLPRRAVAGDRSVADLVAERFGAQVVDLLVEPLLGGVYAGRTDRLGAEATLAPVWRAAAAHRSLTIGLREHLADAADDDRPVFQTLRGGLGGLIDRLVADLGERVRLATPVRAVVPQGATWRVQAGDRSLVCDQVVLAVPAAVAARLVADAVPEPARELAAITSASVGVVALAYDAGTALPRLSGILVPPGEGRLVKAVTLSSRKWQHLAGRDRIWLRASVGRVDDATALDLDDATLADRVDAEVRWATGIQTPARDRLVVRWRDALAQYDLAHRDRVDRIGLALSSDAPTLHVGGAGLDGLGLAARARDAQRLAAAVRSQARPAAAEGSRPDVRSR